MSVLKVEEAPKAVQISKPLSYSCHLVIHGQNRIYNGQRAIERQLGDIRSLKLSVSISELNCRLVFWSREAEAHDAEIASLLDLVLDFLRLFQVDSFGKHEVMLFVRCARIEDELSNLFLLASVL